MQAAGPAAASAAIAVLSPGAAFGMVAVAQVLAAVGLLFLRATPLRREEVERKHPLRAAL
ncbi:MAG: putative arabinose efflux permease, family, partial [Microbacteriaceae bacterium]|nr:putative arabinose efflux permease, family [Microbacteriaceae bacterium]